MRTSSNHGSGNWFPGFLLTVALCAVATITGCALDTETPPTTSEVVPTEETDVDLGTSSHALKIGCASHAECSIETLAGEGYAIAMNGCLLEDALCADLPGGITGCLGTAVDMVCANNLETEVLCNDEIDNDGDGVMDGDDLDCQGTLCDLDESVACMTIGIWTNGDCVANPNPEGTFCGNDDVCQTDSYCDGDGSCIEDDSTSVCCFIDSECADYACPSGQAPFCTPMQYELGSGLCDCFGLNTEVCYDGIDNDGNGLRDCDDPACAELEHCNSTASCCAPHDGIGCEDTTRVMDVCADVDNDEWCCRNNWDWLCVREYNELTKLSPTDPGVCAEPEVCDDFLDNDFDGNWDCEDTDCADDPACTTPDPVCGDTLSCDDPSCEGDPACPIEPPTTAQRVLPEGWSVICWSYVNPLTGSVPNGVGPISGPTPSMDAFSSLCIDSVGDPVDQVICMVRNGSGSASFGYGVPFFEGQSSYTAPACPGFGANTFGCGSSGYGSYDVLCTE